MATLLVLPYIDLGEGLSPSDGALLNFYYTGTEDRKDTYKDEALTIPHANPVVSIGSGVFEPIWVGDGDRYKLVVEKKGNVLVKEYDPVIGGLSNGASGDLVDTVTAMKLTSPLAGQLVTTLGYYAAGDGAGDNYLVFPSTAVDGFGDHVLANGNVAILQEVEPNFSLLGAVADGVTDDGAALQAAISREYVKMLGKPHLTGNALISTEGVHRMSGAWWGLDATETLIGSFIEATDNTVTDLLTVQSDTPGSQSSTDLDNVLLENFGLVHKGSGSALLVDNVIRSQVQALYIDCGNTGAIGIKYDNWGFFSSAKSTVIAGFTEHGVLVDGAGTQHTFNDMHLATTFTGAVAAIETRRPGTQIVGGQINVNDGGNGVGILFNNTSGSSLEGGFVDSVLSEYDTAIKITGTTNYFFSVTAQNVRVTLGGGQKGIIFDRASSCLMLNPQVTGPTGGTIAEWTDLAVKCGVIGNYEACRAGVTVDAAAVDSYMTCTSKITYAERANISTDANLKVTCEDVEVVGRTVHNGTQWDKLWFFMTDDSVVSFPTPSIGGRVRILSRDKVTGDAEISYRLSGATQQIANIAASSGTLTTLVEVTNGTLSGTTGTDGALTVSVDSASEKMYIENRFGSNENIMVIFEGVDW